MATINVTDEDEELSAAKSCAEVLIAQQAARAPGDEVVSALEGGWLSVKEQLVATGASKDTLSLLDACFDCSLELKPTLLPRDIWSVRENIVVVITLKQQFTKGQTAVKSVLKPGALEDARLTNTPLPAGATLSRSKETPTQEQLKRNRTFVDTQKGIFQVWPAIEFFPT
ncbi:serine O-acetyltransferase [Pseudoscourfieldia marina]